MHEGVTGLVDTATNEAVVLSMNNDGVVEGRTATSNDLVFTVSVNGNGTVTLDQLRAVVHSPNTGADQPISLNAADLIQLTATITDKDGDSASAHLDLGQALNFKDDGPSINATTAADTLTVDETTLGNDASANFADNFNLNYGADGAGNVAYSLGIKAGTTGLVDSATNQAVVLSLNNGVVEGKTTGGALVFTVSVDASGNVTLDQLRAVIHSPNTGPDQTTSLNTADLIRLTATITDKDGDSSSASIDIGQALNFKDDGPSINASAAADSLTVDETTLGNDASANFADNFNLNYGADGAGNVAYSLGIKAGTTGLVDSATNQAVVLSLNNGVVEGKTTGGALVFTVSVDASGNVTLDQLRAVIHSPNTGPDQTTSLNAADLIRLTATITDKDGDSSSASIDIGQALNFKDDGPTINASAATDSLTVDETTLGNDASANFADNFNLNYGADGAGNVAYSLGIKAGTTGLVDSATNQAVVLSLNNGVVEGKTTGGALVFTVSVDASGNVTLDQLRAVIHSPNTGPDQTTSLNTADLIRLTATITDKDGDSSSASIDIGQALNFKDDGPTINASAATDSLTVDETTLGNDASANFADNFNLNYGADGAGNVAYSLGIKAGTTGLVDSATNQAVVLSLNNGVVEGKTTGGALVFKVSVDASGNVTLDQLRAVIHSPNTGPDQTTSLNARGFNPIDSHHYR
ncbi:Structural toxin protein RtxA [Legionella hackeliae]|nr:Structural toxin protein RtxA [Legionella hackeliae]